MKHRIRVLTGLFVASLLVAACGGGDGGEEADEASAARGPINVWYSNHPQEIQWAKEMIQAWNSAHPDQQVTGQQIPSGKSSEEVIVAAITAGSTPCLIFNTAQIATPDYEHMGGLVPLDSFPDAVEYIESRSGKQLAEQYKSPDGTYKQIPWKSNPVMLFYNKTAFERAGLDPEKPALSTYEEVLTAARQVVAKGGVEVAIAPTPTAEFWQAFFDFLPLFTAETDGTPLWKDGKSQFTSEEGIRVAEFFQTFYKEGLAPKEPYTVDAFAERKTAMQIVGPWAIAIYKGKVDWGVVPLPTSEGKAPEDTWSFTDAKTIALYSSCQNRGTAWELLKFSTSEEQDGKLVQLTGQMPMRDRLTETYTDYFTKNPAYKMFADQTARVVEVPYVPHSVESWQTFRDAYSASVIFGKEDIRTAFQGAAEKTDKLVSGW
jgi:multiple sugar transport system substrate-binding protein